MIRLFVYTCIGASIGALAGYLLADGLPEGAFVGVLLGASLGIIIAMRRASGAAGASFEYEAAGIHDDNLITTARRNLARGAYRDSFGTQVLEEKIETLASADEAKETAKRENR